MIYFTRHDRWLLDDKIKSGRSLMFKEVLRTPVFSSTSEWLLFNIGLDHFRKRMMFKNLFFSKTIMTPLNYRLRKKNCNNFSPDKSIIFCFATFWVRSPLITFRQFVYPTKYTMQPDCIWNMSNHILREEKNKSALMSSRDNAVITCDRHL